MTLLFNPSRKTALMGVISGVIAMATGLTASAAVTQSITLQGMVAEQVFIEIEGVAPYRNLNLTETATDLHVANVHEISNSATGYTVTLKSINGGSLKNKNDLIPYRARYGLNFVTLSHDPQVIAREDGTLDIIDVRRQLKISYTGRPRGQLTRGIYQDTLQFQISAN